MQNRAFGIPLSIRAHMFMAAAQTNRLHLEGRHFLCHLARELYCRDLGHIRGFSDLCECEPAALSGRCTDQRWPIERRGCLFALCDILLWGLHRGTGQESGFRRS